eukprot:scaffold171497_cov33-Tisochrysis_lutea.AAC.2
MATTSRLRSRSAASRCTAVHLPSSSSRAVSVSGCCSPLAAAALLSPAGRARLSGCLSAGNGTVAVAVAAWSTAVDVLAAAGALAISCAWRHMVGNRVGVSQGKPGGAAQRMEVTSAANAPREFCSRILRTSKGLQMGEARARSE